MNDASLFRRCEAGHLDIAFTLGGSMQVQLWDTIDATYQEFTILVCQAKIVHAQYLCKLE